MTWFLIYWAIGVFLTLLGTEAMAANPVIRYAPVGMVAIAVCLVGLIWPFIFAVAVLRR